ncbi:MAG: zf-HC2 domain-containing protein [Anaeromyxobacter sp.]
MSAATTPCARPDEWLRLVDGELTENRAADLRAHAAGCTACTRELAGAEALVSRLAAPDPEVFAARVVAGAMARLGAAPERERRRPWLGWALAGAATFAVVLALPVALRRGPTEDFTARGGPAAAWAARVGVELSALEKPVRRLGPGASLVSGTAVVASYGNPEPEPAYLLAFALDGANEVHWLYPAFLEPGSDPAAVRLEPATVYRALPDAAVLEGLLPGPLRLVTVVSREPIRVSAVERLAPAERDPEALRRRLPAARVDAIPVVLGPAR